MELKKTIDGVEYEFIPSTEKEQIQRELHRLKEIAIVEAKLFNSLCTTMRLGKKLQELLEGKNAKPAVSSNSTS